MNKIAIIGIIIVVIIGMGAASFIIENNKEQSKNSQSEQLPIIEEIIPVEENIEPEQKGKNISLELTESMGLTSP